MLPTSLFIFLLSSLGLRADYHRLAQVTCPECELRIRPSNFNRHWANQHKGKQMPEKSMLNKAASRPGSSSAAAAATTHAEWLKIEDGGGANSSAAEELLSSDDESEFGDFRKTKRLRKVSIFSCQGTFSIFCNVL